MATWALLPKGFYGVDIFIVIMGYLLIRGFINKPGITIGQFFNRKLARLYFPMAVAIVLTCILSLFCLDADLLTNMAQTGISAMLGEGNFQLKRSTEGYFDSNASMNPFLHLWYLGVATQLFALAYLILICVRKQRTRIIVGFLAILGSISFICTILNPLRSVLLKLGLPCFWEYDFFSYYDSIPRIWELLAGGLVLFLPELKNKKLTSLIVIAALAMVIIPASAKSISSLSIIPVVTGTVLLIRYTDKSHIANLFSNKVTQWLGKISFSLYLVHVPLIVCYKGFFFNDIPTIHAPLILVISIFIAWIFFHLIEKRTPSKPAIIGTWAITTSICLAFWFSDGWRHVWNVESNQITLPQYPLPEQCRFPDIEKGLDSQIMELHSRWYTGDWYIRTNQQKEQALPDYPVFQLGQAHLQPSFVLLGDSHAEHYVPGFDTISKEKNVAGVFLGSIIEPFWNRECPRFDTDYFYNREKAQALFHWLKEHPELKTIIIGQSWNKLVSRNLDWDLKKVPNTIESNVEALREFCFKLKEIGKTVAIIAPLPTVNSYHVLACARWAKRRGIPECEIPANFICTQNQYEEKYGKINTLLNKLESDNICIILRPHLYLFKNGKCPAIKNGVPQFYDPHHITVPASIETARYMLTSYPQLLNPAN